MSWRERSSIWVLLMNPDWRNLLNRSDSVFFVNFKSSSCFLSSRHHFLTEEDKNTNGCFQRSVRFRFYIFRVNFSRQLQNWAEISVCVRGAVTVWLDLDSLRSSFVLEPNWQSNPVSLFYSNWSAVWFWTYFNSFLSKPPLDSCLSFTHWEQKRVHSSCKFAKSRLSSL